MTVAQLQASISNQELGEWRAYYAVRNQREELEMKKAKARSGRRR